MKLRDYQTAAIAKLAHRQITCLPTGTGKTAIFCQVAADRAARGERTWILVHREELIAQTVASLRKVTKASIATVVGSAAFKSARRATIVVAMQQTLVRIPEEDLAKGLPNIDVLIVDEAHRYTTEKTGAVLDAIQEAGAEIYGYTATPQINNKPIYGPGKPFTGISYRRSIVAMIREGYLSDVKAKSIIFDDLDLSKVSQSRGDYSASDLSDKLGSIRAPFRIAEAWAEHASDRHRSIVFLPTVELAQQTAAEFRKLPGTQVVEVYGDTPKHQRASRIHDIRTGKANVLVNVMVGAEGFDVPEIDCVVQARPTRSWTLYVQSVGRGLRIAPDKADCLVLDISGASAHHDLATLPRVVEVPKLGKKSLRQFVEQQDEEKGERQVDIDTSKAVLRETLLYAPIRWTEWGDEHIAPLDSDRVVVLAPVASEGVEDLEWGIFDVDLRSGVETEVGCHPYAADAQEEAEEYVREHGDSKLFRRAEAWRERVPSAGQLKWFRGVPADELPKTRGEASERITLTLYKRIRTN